MKKKKTIKMSAISHVAKNSKNREIDELLSKGGSIAFYSDGRIDVRFHRDETIIEYDTSIPELDDKDKDWTEVIKLGNNIRVIYFK